MREEGRQRLRIYVVMNASEDGTRKISQLVNLGNLVS